MAERLQYVSPEYQLQLENLGDTLMQGVRERLADAALSDTVEFPAVDGQLTLDIPGNIEVGEE